MKRHSQVKVSAFFILIFKHISLKSIYNLRIFILVTSYMLSSIFHMHMSMKKIFWSILIHQFLKNFESHMNALFRYSLTNPAIVGVLLVASCPQTWQYIPLSSEPQFRQFAYGMLSCMLLAFDFCLFLPILLSFGITCHVM